MEQIRTEPIYKTVINETTGDPENVLDYTMRYTYNVETATIEAEVDGEIQPVTKFVETLLKTERIDEYGVWLILDQSGCRNICNTSPTQKYIDEHPEEFTPKPEEPEEKIIRLEAEVTCLNNRLALTQSALDELILGGGI